MPPACKVRDRWIFLVRLNRSRQRLLSAVPIAATQGGSKIRANAKHLVCAAANLY
jgi:hypothetical protein